MSKKVEIEVERKDLMIEYYLEGIIKAMLKNGTKEMTDLRDYIVTVHNDGQKTSERIGAEFTIKIKVSDSMLEKVTET